MTGDVLLDVPTQHVLDLFGLEASLDDQLRVAVHRSASTQLSEQEVQQVLILSVQHPADLCEVGEGRLLRAHAQHLRRTHHELGLAAGCHVGVLVQDDLEHAVQQLVVRVVAVLVSPRRRVVLNWRGGRVLIRKSNFDRLGNTKG